MRSYVTSEIDVEPDYPVVRNPDSALASRNSPFPRAARSALDDRGNIMSGSGSSDAPEWERPEIADRRARDVLDREAMHRLQAGDQAALAELMDRNWSSLVRYALTFLADKDTAEDLVQESFVRIWERRSTWKPIGPVRSYLYRIVRNLALQEKEKRGVRRRWRDSRIHEQPSAPTPAEEAESQIVKTALEQALSNLPTRRREIVVLARFHSLTYSEIAETMGISAQTVANQMSAALAELRRVMAAFRER